jgi:2-haloacid dehalogenase
VTRESRAYRALFFDADDTLLDYPAAERQALKDLFPASAPEDLDALVSTYRRHNAAVWRAYEQGTLTQAALRVERFRRLAEELPLPADDLPAVSARYLDLLAAQAQLIGNAAGVLQALARRYPLALITNGIAAVQRGRLARSGLGPLFASVVISEEAGCAKPDPRIFYPACRALGVAPADVLFVGDSTASDMPAAANAGMDFCWYNPAAAPLPDGLSARYTIACLDELPALLP